MPSFFFEKFKIGVANGVGAFERHTLKIVAVQKGTCDVVLIIFWAEVVGFCECDRVQDLKRGISGQDLRSIRQRGINLFLVFLATRSVIRADNAP